MTGARLTRLGGLGPGRRLSVRGRPGIALDMGSARTRVWLPGRGGVVDVPTVTFPGRGAGHPVQRGVVVDVAGAARMLERLVGRRVSRLARPVIVHTAPVPVDEQARARLRAALAGLRPRRVVTLDSVAAVAMGSGADVSRPLLVVDVGAHLTEVALLVDGVVTDAGRTPLGTADLNCSAVPGDLVDAVVSQATRMLRDDRGSQVVDALERGPLVAGGGALRPEVVYGLSQRLRAGVRTAPAPTGAALRGAVCALRSVVRHPAVVDVPGPARRS
jgi:rod shape-determining protein MreB